MKRLVTFLSLSVLLHVPSEAAEPRPKGENCNLQAPPSSAGEEGGHGFVLLVYPRTKDISPDYSGCQSVFSVSTNQETRLAWVVEVMKGDPIRMWTPEANAKDVQTCRYKAGRLLRGNADTCPKAESLLMPSQPAGCFTKSGEAVQCAYDRE